VDIKRARFRFGRSGVQIPARTVVVRGFFSEVFLSSPLDSYRRKLQSCYSDHRHILKALDFNSVTLAGKA
jgi:hypothetical protein